MSTAARALQVFRAVLPSPLAIALLLTAFTFILAFFLTGSELPASLRALNILGYWEKGLWNSPLLAFAMQMMLMLVLGHALALTRPAERLITFATRFCTSAASSAAVVAFLAIVVGYINWGLALIFGAILARKVGEHARSRGIPLNYPLIGAAGYAGMMIWHGGISGSSLVKVAESGHLKQLLNNHQAQLAETMPDKITFTATVFSGMNLTTALLLLILVPATLYLIGARSKPTPLEALPQKNTGQVLQATGESHGAEKLDHVRWMGGFFGALIIGYATYTALFTGQLDNLGFITPDYINFCLLGWCLLLHQNLQTFAGAVGEAMVGAGGILIQFPLYFGIMGIMNHSGLVSVMARFFISISNEYTYPVFTFLSAGLVNFFVPSGGGQWMVQGPIVLEAASELGISLSKSIMALAYGDQVTNMLQPFWALPLLGITGLKAKDLLPYTAVMMLLASFIFILALLLF
jgi:short-chain fatty acids transporter